MEAAGFLTRSLTQRFALLRPIVPRLPGVMRRGVSWGWLLEPCPHTHAPESHGVWPMA